MLAPPQITGDSRFRGNGEGGEWKRAGMREWSGNGGERGMGIFLLPGCLAHSAASRPPPKERAGVGAPPGTMLTAQYLNSGILPNGSKLGFVSIFAAAS